MKSVKCDQKWLNVFNGLYGMNLISIKVLQIPAHINHKLHTSQTGNKLLLRTDLLCSDEDIDEEENASASNDV